MMTYMRFLKIENGFVIYEYGKSETEIIGTVSVEIANKNNFKFTFYEQSKIKRFCTSTSHALKMIFKFIRNNDYPEKYVYAC